MQEGRQRSVLAALALSGDRAVSLDELADTVWDGEPPAAAEATLRNYVSRLRRALGPSGADQLVTRRSGYLLQLAEEELDLTHLEALHRAGTAAFRSRDWPTAGRTLADALSLWRGLPLTDVPSRTLQHEHRQRLAQVRLQIVEQRIEADLHLGRHDQLAPELRDLVRRHPLHERFHTQLMVVLAHCGRQAEALAVFQGARRLLVAELGMEPGSELQTVHQRILSGDSALLAHPAAATAGPPATPPPAQLPSDQVDFIGRDDLISYLSAALRGSASGVFASVSGTGGTGKTALAVHLAQQLREHFPDGQIHVDLGGSGLRPQDPGQLLGRLLRDLGLSPEAVPADPQERAARYRSLLAGRRVLVLLDDARDDAQIRPLLPGSGSSRALVTSRARLSTLYGAHQVELGPLDEAEARALFRRIAGYQRVDAEPDATDMVLSACEGLPLAVRIAAERLTARPDWRVQVLADRLADEGHRLDELAVGSLAMRSGFDADYARLLADAKEAGTSESAGSSGDAVHPARFLRLLGSTVGPHIGLPAVAALLAVPVEQTGPALEALVDANLLHSSGPGRYRLTGLTRAYAVARAEAEETVEARGAAARRLLAWYLRTATAASRHLTTDRGGGPADLPDVPGPVLAFADGVEAWAWLDTEAPNLVDAVHQAARLTYDDIAWRLPLVLHEFLMLRGTPGEGAELYEVAFASARRADEPQAEAHVLTRLADACRRAGRHHESLHVARQALGMWQALGDRWMRADTLLVSGAAHHRLGHHAEAVRDFTEAAALSRTLGYPRGERAALSGLDALARISPQAGPGPGPGL
ncbi:AfsR/SARP family transcriptional regulator [Streptacidiphilus sp. PAMC 29251]